MRTSLVGCGLGLLLIFMGPNLSAACLVLLLAALAVFAGGARIGHFILLVFIGMPLLWGQVDSAGYRMKRIVAFLDPSHDPAGVSYQLNQARIAVGSGGMWGGGFGHGVPKFGHPPAPPNDFIPAMVCAGWGVIRVVPGIAESTPMNPPSAPIMARMKSLCGSGR